MGTAFRPAKTSPASWDAFSDVDAFVDAVLAELAADGTRRTRSGPKPPRPYQFGERLFQIPLPGATHETAGGI
jgi:hypothetical protein